jgi:hypothetical protein
MMFFSASVQSDKSRGSFDDELVRKSFMIGRNTQGNHLARDELNDLGLRIRDRIHLLAPNSSWVEEIEENWFPE